MVITPMRLILINLLVLAMFSYLRATLLPMPGAMPGLPELPAPDSPGPALRAGRLAERVATSVAVVARELREPVEVAPEHAPALVEAPEEEDSLTEIAAMEGVASLEPSAMEGELPEETEDIVDAPLAQEPVELVASPLELAVVAPPEEQPEPPPESQEDATRAAVEVAKAVAVADAVAPGAPGAAPAGPAEQVVDADEEEDPAHGGVSLPSAAPQHVAAEDAVSTTLARYTDGVRLVRGHLRKQDWAGAVAVADQLLELVDLIGEQRAWLLYLKARAERGRGHLLAAASLYGEAIDHDPPGAHYKNSLAWMMCSSKDPRVRDLEAAVQMAEEAVRDGGSRPQYLDTLARAYFEAGRYDDAVLTQRRAVEGDPDRASFKSRLEWYRDEAIELASR